MNIREKNQSTGNKLLELLKTISDNQYVQCPCKVLAVNGNYVDVLPIINDDLVNQPLYDVKIQRKESSTAYIFLGVHVGDRGILRFFDRSIENYSINGSEEYNQDDRMHDANDGCFELGFLPDNEAYQYLTTAELELGLKTQTFKLSVDASGNLVITSATNVINGNTTINGNLVVNGEITATGEIQNSKKLSAHTHTDSMGGATSAPN